MRLNTMMPVLSNPSGVQVPKPEGLPFRTSKDSEPALRFGHGAPGKNKPKSPWKLVVWSVADVLMLGGSVFFADMVVPEHHHDEHDRPAAVAPENPGETPANPQQGEGQAGEDGSFSDRIKRTFTVSGLAAFIHLLSHMGLAGGWFLYGRHRGNKTQNIKNADFQAFQQYADKLSKEGGNFQLVPLGEGEFKVIKAEPEQSSGAPPAQ